MPTTSVLVRADWGTTGLWDSSPGGFGPVELDELPVSGAFRLRFDAWTQRLEALRTRSEYPPDWQFASALEAIAFVDDGARLAADLQIELGPGWTVSYEPFPR